MDALFRILARISAVDAATSVVGRVAGAFQRLGTVIGAAAASVLAFGGVKGFYDWTVGAAANLQQMEIGMAAIITANSQLQGSVFKSGTQDFAINHFNVAAKEATKIMDLLQQKSIAGIGSLNDYVMTANTVMPALLAAMKDANPEKISQFVHLTQMSAATLLAGRGNGQGMFSLAAREMAHAIQGSARSSMPYVRNLLAGMDLKAFNQMGQTQRLEVLQQRLKSFEIMSEAISGSWSNITSAAQEMVQYIGRFVGRPILDFLQKSVMQIRMFRLLMRQPNKADLGKDHLLKPGQMGPTMTGQQKFLNESTNAWQQIKDWAIDAGQRLVAAIIWVRDTIIGPIRHNWDTICANIKFAAMALITAAAAMKASALVTRASNMGFFNGRTTRGARRADGLMGIIARANDARRGGIIGRAGQAAFRNTIGAGAMGIMATSGSPMGRGFGALIARIIPILAPLMRLVTIMSLWGGVVLAIIGVVGLLMSNFMGLRDLIWGAIMRVVDALKGALMSWMPVLKVVGGILLVVAAILGGAVILAFNVFLTVLRVVIIAIGKVGEFFGWVMQKITGDVGTGGQSIVDGFVGILNAIIRAVNTASTWIKDKTGGVVNFGTLQQVNGANIKAMMGAFTPSAIMAGAQSGWDAAMKQARQFGMSDLTSIQGGGKGGNLDYTGGDGHGDKDKKRAHPRNVQIFNKGAIQIEIKNMNNYPPDRIAYDMKRILLDKLNQKTTGTSGGLGQYSHGYGGR